MAAVAISSGSYLRRHCPLPGSTKLPASSSSRDVANVLVVKFPSLFSTKPAPYPDGRIRVRRKRMTCFKVASRSDFTELDDQPSLVSSREAGEGSSTAASATTNKIGARVRVKVPLKVFHVPKVSELDLLGKEGQVKQNVGLWKGKHLSANLPFKVAFVIEIEGRGPVKFFAHLSEDEFDFLEGA